MSDEKQAYVKKMRARLDEWRAEIDRLKAKAEGQAADAEIEYNKELKVLEQKRDDVEKKLKDLEGASSDAWGDLKDGLEGAWTTLGNAIKSASARFKT